MDIFQVLMENGALLLCVPHSSRTNALVRVHVIVCVHVGKKLRPIRERRRHVDA